MMRDSKGDLVFYGPAQRTDRAFTAQEIVRDRARNVRRVERMRRRRSGR